MFGFVLVLLLGFGCVCWGFLWVLVGFCFFSLVLDCGGGGFWCFVLFFCALRVIC